MNEQQKEKEKKPIISVSKSPSLNRFKEKIKGRIKKPFFTQLLTRINFNKVICQLFYISSLRNLHLQMICSLLHLHKNDNPNYFLLICIQMIASILF